MSTVRKVVLSFGIIMIGAIWSIELWRKIHLDQLSVTVSEKLSKDKIRIDLGFFDPDAASDEVLIKRGLPMVVFINGKARDFEANSIENDFLIVYDNKYYTIVRHIVPSAMFVRTAHRHMYNVDLNEVGGKIHLTFDVDGIEGVIIEKDLESVVNASDNLWGVRKQRDVF
ncbi:MAG: hypothetical protein K1X55_00010 [Chitinophagales bacterium]|nr:hypothetical protein [Chitinophagales bacterium]